MSGAKHVSRPRRWLAVLGLVAIPLTFAIAGGTAYAYWIAGSTAGSNGAAAATSVNAGATPTVNATGTTATVSWSASTLASGQAVTGYLVKRYNATTLVAQTILTACTGTVTSTSCVESAVPQGSWKYSVTPVFATNWRGVESAKSATVVIDTTAPTNALTLTNVTGGAYLSGTSVYYRGSAVGSFTIRNAVADAGSGPASSQTAALTGTTTGWTHTPSTVSTPTGGPFVSNAFSWAAASTSGPGEVVTGRDVNANAATTSLTFVNDSTAPSAGTVSYANGLTGGTTVSVSFTTGTDAGSAIATRLLQRAAAPATQAGACGTYGAFATVTNGTNPTSPVTDTVALGFCYMYQYVVTDNVGNSTTASNVNVARAPYGASYTLNENTGTTAADGTGMGNTGTLQAAAGWTPGRFGSAVSMTGTATSWVDIARPVVDTSKSYSVAAWVKFNNVSGFQTIASMDGTNISPFYLQLEAGRIRFSQRSADSTVSTVTQVTGPVATTNEWYHVVGVYDQTAGTIQLYVNGVSIGSTAYTSAWKANGHTTLGRAKWNGAGVDFVNGAIDDVYFYDRAITGAEVTALRGPLGASYAFDAGSGTTAVDGTGNTNTGVLQTGATWSAGKVGAGALSFNGTTGYVDVNTPVLNTAETYTVATWVKLNNVTTYQTFASVQGVAVSPFQLQLTNGGKFRLIQYATDSTASAYAFVDSAAAVAGTWYHLAGVYDKTANTIQLYVNGTSVGSVAAVTPWTAYGHTTIGRTWWNGAASDFVNGSLDETRFYSRALSATEIGALAGTYSTVVSATPNLASYWRLGEASGTVATDTEPTAPNTGTYTNAPTLGAAGAISSDTNTAVTFDGIDDYISAANQTYGDLSIELWFKSTQFFSNDFGNPHCTQWWQGAALADADVSGAFDDFGVGLCDGKVIGGIGNGAGSADQSVVSATTYNDGNWHHVVLTRTQATGVFQLYVDGVSQGTGTSNTRPLDDSAAINFGRTATGVNYFAGTLDEIAIYNAVLSGATISNHYAVAR